MTVLEVSHVGSIIYTLYLMGYSKLYTVRAFSHKQSIICPKTTLIRVNVNKIMQSTKEW